MITQHFSIHKKLILQKKIINQNYLSYKTHYMNP